MRTTEMTIGEAAALYVALSNLGHIAGRVAFTYAVVKNKSTLKPHYDALQAARQPPPEAAEYDRKRIAMVIRFAVRDAQGQPVVREGGGIMVNLDTGYREEIARLQDAYPEAVKVLDDHLHALDELSKKTAGPIKLATCMVDDLPEMTPAALEAILPMVVDPAAEDEHEPDPTLLAPHQRQPLNEQHPLNGEQLDADRMAEATRPQDANARRRREPR